MKEYASDQSRILVSGRLVQRLTNNGVQSSRKVAENLVSVFKPGVTVFLNIGVLSLITVTAP